MGQNFFGQLHNPPVIPFNPFKAVIREHIAIFWTIIVPPGFQEFNLHVPFFMKPWKTGEGEDTCISRALNDPPGLQGLRQIQCWSWKSEMDDIWWACLFPTYIHTYPHTWIHTCIPTYIQHAACIHTHNMWKLVACVSVYSFDVLTHGVRVRRLCSRQWL